MSANKVRHILVGVLAAVIFVGLSLGAGAETVSVRTNSGDVLQGVVSGLAAVLRLEDPTPAVGPAAQFDIPLSLVEQIWVDFPRVIIETATHIIVGPSAAFSGIAQMLRVERLGDVTQVPFAAIRQIAFGDTGFRELPWEWLGRSWLTRDWQNLWVYITPKTASKTGTEIHPQPSVTYRDPDCPNCETKPVVYEPPCPNCATSPAAEVLDLRLSDSATTSAPAYLLAANAQVVESSSSDEVVWNGATPAAAAPAPASTSGELPWWVLLVGVAVLIAAFLFIPTGNGT